MKWTELLTAVIDDTYASTEGLLQLVTDDKLDWKPTTGENWLTTGQLLQHISNAGGMPMRGLVTGDWGMPAEEVDDMPADAMLPPADKFPTATSVAAVRSQLQEDRELAHRMVKEAGEDRLQNEPSSVPWDPTPLSLGRRVLQMVGHLDNHQSQLYYYLKLQGAPVNTMHLYGMGASAPAE